MRFRVGSLSVNVGESDKEQPRRCDKARTSISNACSRMSANRVPFQQALAGGIVSLVGKGSTAFLATGAKKFIALEVARRYGADMTAQQVIIQTATCATNFATVGVAAVDTVSAAVFAEAEGKETWKGTFKRNVPGLLTAMGATFITGAALPEALVAYGTYKIAGKVMNFLDDYSVDKDAKFVDMHTVKAKMKQIASAAAADVPADAKAKNKKQ